MYVILAQNRYNTTSVKKSRQIYFATRSELDEFEQRNIEQAVQWTLGRTFKSEVIYTEVFIRKVHQQMYADVWAWAGDYRKTNKNLGVDK